MNEKNKEIDMKEYIEERLNRHKEGVSEWLARHRERVRSPIYASVDIRDSGKKVGVVDTNVFPGGFNNLCDKNKDTCSSYIKRDIESLVSAGKGEKKPIKVLLVPESHTRNKFYLDNVHTLSGMIRKGGFELTLGYLESKEKEEGREGVKNAVDFPLKLKSAAGKILEFEEVRRKGNAVYTEKMTPDVVLLNNDLSHCKSEILEGIEQPVAPPVEMGWCFRRKSDHFRIYNGLIEELCGIIDIDPWLLSPVTSHESNVNFGTKDGLDRIAESVGEVLEAIEEKYEEYGMKQKPYVFIKNNAGTYGRAITAVESKKEVLEMSGVKRKRMLVGKDGADVTGVLIQEGVPTKDRIGRAVTEPVIYLVGGRVVGGFLRTHDLKSDRANLNAPGMGFAQLCFAGPDSPAPEVCIHEASTLNVFKTIAEVANIAIGYEILEKKVN